jgi:hypothetical protein
MNYELRIGSVTFRWVRNVESAVINSHFSAQKIMIVGEKITVILAKLRVYFWLNLGSSIIQRKYYEIS